MRRGTETKKRQELQNQSTKDLCSSSKWRCQDNNNNLDLEFSVEYEESYAAFCTHKPKRILHFTQNEEKETGSGDKRKLPEQQIDESIDDIFDSVEKPNLNKSLSKECESAATSSKEEVTKRYKSANKIEWNSQDKNRKFEKRDGK